MDNEKLNWRSFVDDQNTIASKWNVTGTPTLYIIDHRGVIQYKWKGNPGPKAIDAALEELIQQAETDAKKSLK